MPKKPTGPSPVPVTNLRRERFIQAYLGAAKGNAADAARLAGYTDSVDSLKVQGSRLLSNVYVQARITGRLDAEGATHDAVLRELAGLAFSHTSLDEFGEVLNPQAVQAKTRALELLGKYHAMWTDVVRSADIPKDDKALEEFITREYKRVRGEEPADPEPVH